MTKPGCSTNGDTREVCTTDGGMLAPAAASAVLVAAPSPASPSCSTGTSGGEPRWGAEAQSFSTGA